MHRVQNTPVYDTGLGILRKLPFVFEKQVRQEYLDLVGGEETPRTGLRAVAKTKMLGTCADEIGLLSLCRILAHFEEAISVELVTVFVESIVPHVRWADSTQGPLGDHHAVGQANVAQSDTIEEA